MSLRERERERESVRARARARERERESVKRVNKGAGDMFRNRPGQNEKSVKY
jgi:hypothetical protein